MIDMKRHLLVSLAVMAGLTGCQTVTSRQIPRGIQFDSDAPINCQDENRDPQCRGATGLDGASPSRDAAGIVYFLPRQLARVTATRTDLSLDALISAVVKAQSELDAAKAALAAARAALAQTEQAIIDGTGGAPAQSILNARRTIQQSELATATSAVPLKQAALDQAKAVLAATAALVTAQSEFDSIPTDDARFSESLRQTRQAIVAGQQAEQQLPGLRQRLADLQQPGTTDRPRTSEEREQVNRAVAQAERNVREADAAMRLLPALEAQRVTFERQLTAVRGTGRQTALSQARATFATVTGIQPPATVAEPRFRVTLKIELLAPSADPNNAYRLNPRHEPFRDDQHDLVVSPAGLLTSTNVVAVDRTADILVEIGTFAGAISGLPGGDGIAAALPGGNSDAGTRCTETRTPNEYTGVVDFADRWDVEELNDHLQCLGVRTRVSGQTWLNGSRPESSPTGNVDGIVYRNPVEVTVEIEKCFQPDGNCAPGDAAWRVTEAIALALPQAGPISFVEQEAGFMTRTSYDLAFKDGILTSYDASRPSELLELFRTPMRVVDGVFSGASRILSLRTGQNNALAALTASDLAVLNANIGLQAGQITGQGTLNTARLNALNAEFALRAAQLAGETGLTNAQITALNAEYALRVAQINGPVGIQNAQTSAQSSNAATQLNLLQAQAALATGGNNAASQVLVSDFALAVAQLRDQARREALSRCIAQQQSIGAPIDSCLVGL